MAEEGPGVVDYGRRLLGHGEGGSWNSRGQRPGGAHVWRSEGVSGKNFNILYS